MNSRNKIKASLILTLSIILELIVGFIINKLSSENFDFSAPYNIWLLAIFVVLVVALIVCKILEHNFSVRARSKRFQKIFKDNGGFEAIVDEMKDCIKKHDYKSFKQLKRIAEDFEK